MSKADYFGMRGALFAILEPPCFSLKTPQPSFLGASETFSQPLPKSGGMRNGLCSERGTLVPHISGKESGSLGQIQGSFQGLNFGSSERGWLATPTAKANQTSPDMVRKWASVRRWLPTPSTTPDSNRTNAALYVCSGGTMRVRMRCGHSSRAGLSAQVGGPVRPQFVEWMMGLPTEWTDCAALETHRFQEWQRLHLPFWLAD